MIRANELQAIAKSYGIELYLRPGEVSETFHAEVKRHLERIPLYQSLTDDELQMSIYANTRHIQHTRPFLATTILSIITRAKSLHYTGDYVCPYHSPHGLD